MLETYQGRYTTLQASLDGKPVKVIISPALAQQLPQLLKLLHNYQQDPDNDFEAHIFVPGSNDPRPVSLRALTLPVPPS